MTAPAETRGGRLRPVQRLLILLPVVIGAIVIDFGLADSGPVRALELLSLDLRFAWRGPVAPGGDVAIVAIDDRSIADLGQWPLPRAALADAIDRLSESGAAVIGLNLLLAEPAAGHDHTEIALLREAAAALPATEGDLAERIERRLRELDADLRLGVAILRSDRTIVPFASVADARNANIAGVPIWIRRAAFASYRHANGAQGVQPQVAGLLVPTASLASVGRGIGHVVISVAEDEKLRYDLPALAIDEDVYPSLAVTALRLFAGVDPSDLVVDLGRGIQIGPYRVEIDRASRQIVNYYGEAGTIPTYSMRDLLKGALPTEALRGKIVLIGANAAGTGDRFPTPLSGVLPGTEHIATAIDNILTDRELRRNPGTRAVDLAGIALLAGLGCLLGARGPVGVSVVLGGLLTAGWLAIASFAFVRLDWWLSVPVPIGAGLASIVLVETLRIGEDRQRRRRLERQRSNLGRYFSPAMVERLAQLDRPFDLDRTQQAAVMFVDMVQSVTLLERMSPPEAMRLLRGFHRRVEEATFAHGGMIDKFLGDGAIVCFGIPEVTSSPAADALRAALELARGLEQAPPDDAAERIAVRIGLHYGPVLMGEIGGERQFQFTVVGDTVNVAARLQDLCREHQAVIAASAAIADALASEDRPLLDRFEIVADVPLRGRDALTTVHMLPRAALAAPG